MSTQLKTNRTTDNIPITPSPMPEEFDKIVQDICGLEIDDIFSYLENNKNCLLNISCCNPVIVSVEQALRDFRREKVLLNDVLFIPDSLNPPYFPSALRLLIQRQLSINPQVSSDQATRISDVILQRACRTSAGADSFFKIQTMFDINGFVLTQHTNSCDAPIKVDFFVKEDCSCARIEVWNTYALHKLDHLDEMDGDHASVIPWMLIDTVVIDESNFKTNDNRRWLKISVCNPRGCRRKSAKTLLSLKGNNEYDTAKKPGYIASTTEDSLLIHKQDKNPELYDHSSCQLLIQ
eukprot:gene4218-8393_t